MQKQLRHLALVRQGLTSHQPFGAGVDGARCAIEHLGYLQIDTLSVVERAHHHILWTRVPDYEPSYLNQLLREQQVFEYWFHAASYLPMDNYRFALPQMKSVRSGAYRYLNNVNENLMHEILDRVRIDGPLRLRNISSKEIKKESGWWNLGTNRRALDRLFMQGDLMVCERNGMEKVYDLAERVLPSHIDLREPTLIEYAEYLLDSTLKSHGIVTWKQLVHLKTDRALKNSMKQLLANRLEEGTLILIKDPQLPECFVEQMHLSIWRKNPQL